MILRKQHGPIDWLGEAIDWLEYFVIHLSKFEEGQSIGWWKKLIIMIFLFQFSQNMKEPMDCYLEPINCHNVKNQYS